MMQEILFRGKAANRNPKRSYRTKYKNGDWVYGLLTNIENYYAGFAEMINTNGVSGIEVDKNTVGQFTGLTDKNGKKIFEGDIIGYKGHTGYVNYDFGCFCVHEMGHSKNNPAIDIVMCCNAVKVIGNIHDNPELLED